MALKDLNDKEYKELKGKEALRIFDEIKWNKFKAYAPLALLSAGIYHLTQHPQHLEAAKDFLTRFWH